MLNPRSTGVTFHWNTFWERQLNSIRWISANNNTWIYFSRTQQRLLTFNWPQRTKRAHSYLTERRRQDHWAISTAGSNRKIPRTAPRTAPREAQSAPVVGNSAAQIGGTSDRVSTILMSGYSQNSVIKWESLFSQDQPCQQFCMSCCLLVIAFLYLRGIMIFPRRAEIH